VLNASLATGYSPSLVEQVQVPKLGLTTRPAADLSIEDQVVLASLVAFLRQKVHAGLVTFTGKVGGGISYKEFENFPVTVTNAKYVLEADAASFYEYVGHERLGYELVGLTGEAATTDALLRLLEGWLGAPRGLPQGPKASETLADIYISPVGRALARAGFQFVRYSDDFKIPVDSWNEARRAQLLLEAFMRDVGLVIAAGKLRTPRMKTYQRYLAKVEDSEDEDTEQVGAQEAAEEDEDIDYFSREFEAGLVSPEELTSASQSLRKYLRRKRVDFEGTRIVTRALRSLAKGRSIAAIPALTRLLYRYPHLTQTISNYTRLLMEGQTEHDALAAIHAWLRDDRQKYPWQVGWMLRASAFATEIYPDLATWTTGILFNDAFPWFVRGQAAISLAVHGKLPGQADYFNVYEVSPEATKPDLIAAVTIARPSWAGRFLGGVATRFSLAAVSQLSRASYREWI
jgi:hypothetical protein